MKIFKIKEIHTKEFTSVFLFFTHLKLKCQFKTFDIFLVFKTVMGFNSVQFVAFSTNSLIFPRNFTNNKVISELRTI